MMYKNEYPTLSSDEFLKMSDGRVDTHINNMWVTLERNPVSRANYIKQKHDKRNNAISTTETIVLSGNKPKVMTIRQPAKGQLCIIDWLNITFDIATIGEKYRKQPGQTEEEYLDLCQSAMAEISLLLCKILGVKYKITKQNQTGRNFYSYSYEIGENYGVVCIGGQRDTVLIMLNGTGCALAPLGWESYMYDFLTKKAVKPKITRIDLAHDDLKGEYLDVHVLDQLETDGYFHCGGALPSTQHLGDWKYDDPYQKGLTLNIGQRSSGKFARFYERGKNLVIKKANGLGQKLN